MSSSDDLNTTAQDFVDKLSGDIIVDSSADNNDNIINTTDNTKDETNDESDKLSQDSKGGNLNSQTENKQQINNNSNDDGKNILIGKRFYINRDEDAHDSVNDADQLESLISAHGGQLLNEIPKEPTNDVVIVSPYNVTKLPTVTPTYIRACVKSNSLLDMKNYLVPYDDFRSVIDKQLHDENNKTGTDIDNAENNNDENSNIDNEIKEENTNKSDDGDDDKEDEDEDLKLFHDATSNNDATSLVQVDEQQSGTSRSEVNGNVDNQSQLVSDVQQYQTNRTMMSRSNLPSHNKASFTEDEDEFILDVVRKNPTRRTTHTLFDEISHYVPNHTGNSIRHRFRVYLSKRLEYVYEVDKYGKLVRDSSGNLIKTKVLPPSLKRKFTADEDYTLAIAVKRQFYRDLFQIDPESGVSLITTDDSPTAIARRNMTMDPNHVPGQEPTFGEYRTEGRRGPIAREFFKTFADEHTTHTENAWRDRFRKFLLVYGLDSYIHYYETETAAGRDPEPIKNMTNRPKREGVPTPGNYNSAVKRARSSPPVRSRVAQSVANQSMSMAAAAAAAANDHNNMANDQRTYPIPENELLDEETMHFISTLKNNLSNMDNSLPFEYPQEIADAIRHDFSIEEAEYDNIDPDTIPFPPEIATIDLFLPTFFQMSSTREFMQKIDEVISRDYEPSQAEKLVQDLCDEAGVRKTFSTSILTALSGDLMVFPRYFLNSFKHNANPPMNVPGIWTREDDEMLRSGKDDELKLLEKKHGAGRIEMRRRFIEKDLI